MATRGAKTKGGTPPVTFHGMVAGSPQMQELFELVRRVARTDASVLIRGETGTGKELVARALHKLSRRAAKPFRAINCAMLAPDLLASELFGHVRGAFTGAVSERRGLFSLADGGTLFFDEVAEIRGDIQAQLLRVLQERTFVPMGGTEPVTVNVRVLAATHRSLRCEVEAGRFREDLMYRIRVVPLFLPPLRERTGDVERLAAHFVAEMNERGERRIETTEDDALDAMLEHPWPGNVRELRNVIEYAFAVGDGPTLRFSELPPEIRGQAPPECPNRQGPFGKERHRLTEALESANGRKDHAAKSLGISRQTLWRKLREHGLLPGAR